MVSVAQGLDLFIVESYLAFNDTGTSEYCSSCTEVDDCLLGTVNYYIQDQCLAASPGPDHYQQPIWSKFERIGDTFFETIFEDEACTIPADTGGSIEADPQPFDQECTAGGKRFTHLPDWCIKSNDSSLNDVIYVVPLVTLEIFDNLTLCEQDSIFSQEANFPADPNLCNSGVVPVRNDQFAAGSVRGSCQGDSFVTVPYSDKICSRQDGLALEFSQFETKRDQCSPTLIESAYYRKSNCGANANIYYCKEFFDSIDAVTRLSVKSAAGGAPSGSVAGMIPVAALWMTMVAFWGNIRE